MQRVLSVTLVFFFTAFTAACANVEPWQRGTLAHPCMQVAPTPEVQAARDHVLSVREGAAGAHGAGGGGCGCN